MNRAIFTSDSFDAAALQGAAAAALLLDPPAMAEAGAEPMPVQEPWPYRRPPAQDDRAVRARHVIYRAGDALDGVPVVTEGWAACISRLSNGRRQILNFLLPGDLVCATAVFTGRVNVFVEAVTAVRFFCHDRNALLAVMAEEPQAFNALIRSFLCEKSQSDQLVADLGQRSAPERIARLILHLLQRLELRGLVHDGECILPLRQQHLADTTGLTPVYVNRVLRAFRADGIVELSGGRLRVLDLAMLRRVADGRA